MISISNLYLLYKYLHIAIVCLIMQLCFTFPLNWTKSQLIQHWNKNLKPSMLLCTCFFLLCIVILAQLYQWQGVWPSSVALSSLHEKFFISYIRIFYNIKIFMHSQKHLKGAYFMTSIMQAMKETQAITKSQSFF